MFALCVLPLWSYGYTTVIGENWDAEIYLGLGEYLKVYPQSGLAMAVPNPKNCREIGSAESKQKRLPGFPSSCSI